jgi:hypothetical protein
VSDLWKKLNLSNQKDIVVLGAPASFDPALEALEGRVTVRRRLTGKSRFSYLVAFVTKRSEIAKLATGLSKQAVGDAILWVAYPKASSKCYSCDFSRDSGWEPLGEAGFEGVRQIAIDEDWSALRFRRVEYIKEMKRDPKRALTKRGKSRQQ